MVTKEQINMKNEKWVLMCCVSFALVMLIGLTIQSCRSNSITKLRIDTDSVGALALVQENDSLYFRNLFQKYRKQFSFRRELFTPVQDSTGKTIGSVLSERQKIDLLETVEKDSTELKHLSTKQSEDRQTDLKCNSEMALEKKKRPPNIYVAILGLMILFGFVYVIRRRS